MSIATTRTLALALAGVLGALAPAAAQSKRYPPEPVDKDAEEAASSQLWEAATNPRQTPYALLVAEAEAKLKARTTDGAAEAIAKLDEAVRLVPDEPRAYVVRGEAHLAAQDWARCAADLAAAAARARPRAQQDDPKATAELRRKLGLCQARAGQLADAERTLAEAIASGTTSGEVWMRLGEVRIAMGKLEEAIGALEAAADTSDGSQVMIAWLLAGAYDRARRPMESAHAVRRAIIADRELRALSHPTLPLLGAGEDAYLMALGYGDAENPRPEYALVYFRRFVELAPASPWRKRAEEHLRELRAVALPETVLRQGGNAQIDLAAARTAVRKHMPALRACLAAQPGTVVKVDVTRTGPRTPPTTRDRPRYYAPPEAIEIRAALALGASRAEQDAAIRCLEPLAARVALPAVRERDTYYKVSFLVVGP